MNWMDVKQREDLGEDVPQLCQCCLGPPDSKGIFKDYREVKQGSVVHMFVCSKCLELDDSKFWKKRTSTYRRKHMAIHNPLVKEKKFKVWRRSNTRRRIRSLTWY